MFATAFLPEFLAIKHESRILGHSSNPVCGISMMEQVRLCAVWLWLGSSLNQIQGMTTVRESFSRVLEQRTLGGRRWQTNGGLIFLPLEMEVSFPHAILDPLSISARL